MDRHTTLRFYTTESKHTPPFRLSNPRCAPCPCLGKVRSDPSLEPNHRTYTAAINCFKQFQGGQPVASLASTLAGFSSREEDLLDPASTSDVFLLAGLPDQLEVPKIGEEES